VYPISLLNKDNIKLEIYRGDIKDRFVDINFGEESKYVNKLYIMTNDGFGQYFTPHPDANGFQSIK
jgi:hypothetical protein